MGEQQAEQVAAETSDGRRLRRIEHLCTDVHGCGSRPARSRPSVGWSGPSGSGRADEGPKSEEEELRLAEAQARKATSQTLRSLKSAHYQAIGDASEAFIKLTLADCEKMAADYREPLPIEGIRRQAAGPSHDGPRVPG